MSLSELEQNVLWQLKAKAGRVPSKRPFRMEIFFKSKEPTSVYYIPTSAYCAKATDIDKAFKTLIRAFKEDSKIIDFDIDGVDRIPPVPSRPLRSIEEVQEVIDDLEEQAIKDIRSGLPFDLRDKPDKVSLRGSIINVHVRVVNEGIVYDFLGADDPSRAVPLTSFLYRKAAKINELSASVSLIRATKLKIVAVDRENDYAVKYVEPLW